jgi:hypothetical protein
MFAASSTRQKTALGTQTKEEQRNAAENYKASMFANTVSEGSPDCSTLLRRSSEPGLWPAGFCASD